ncbi:MAG: 1-acyl-sn-glycerol-3-phosphate acyltransferase [Chloroflexi bacterium]|nr:1-acyl-sn-glycerol-3-phosphate acyltransferase [Chloroflexota bacterium]
MRDLFTAVFYAVNIGTWAKVVVALNINLEVVGRERVPRKGPLILACNHLNIADPPIITVAFPRRVVWMAKRELFDTPVLGILYHLYGCLPVRRTEADLKALREAQDVLRKGLVLGMFPEGTRSRIPGLRKAEPGTALIALRTGVPIVPVAITGTEPIHLPGSLFQFLQRRRHHVRLAFGEPFTLPQVERVRTEAVEQGADMIMRRIAELLPLEYQGIYADAAAAPAGRSGES